MARARKPGTVELNRAAVGRLLRSKPIAAAVEDTADRIQEIAEAQNPGAKYSVRVFQGRDRVRAHVGSENEAAMFAEVQRRALSRAAAAARRTR